jgi:dTDP-4-amino-4,6-dideoxygalactose transaminase
MPNLENTCVILTGNFRTLPNCIFSIKRLFDTLLNLDIYIIINEDCSEQKKAIKNFMDSNIRYKNLFFTNNDELDKLNFINLDNEKEHDLSCEVNFINRELYYSLPKRDKYYTTNEIRSLNPNIKFTKTLIKDITKYPYFTNYYVEKMIYKVFSSIKKYDYYFLIRTDVAWFDSWDTKNKNTFLHEKGFREGSMITENYNKTLDTYNFETLIQQIKSTEDGDIIQTSYWNNRPCGHSRLVKFKVLDTIYNKNNLETIKNINKKYPIITGGWDHEMCEKRVYEHFNITFSKDLYFHFYCLIIRHNTYNWLSNKRIDQKLVTKYLKDSIITNQFTNGGINVKRLEQYIKNKFKIDDNKSVIVVTNGSVALHVLSSAIEIYENKKINWATQSFTFPPSTQGTLSNVKIVDIDEEGGLDLDKLDETTNGIIVTNIFGNVVNIDKYEKWSKNKNFLIFDNAATAYTFYKSKNCLNYGKGCTISFHHTKPFGFGEGGAIIVDKVYEKTIRCLNNFGIGLGDNYFAKEGNNNKMSEISAVYILQYLENNFEFIIKKHQLLYDHFKKLIIENNVTDFKLFPNYYSDKCCISCITILLNTNNTNLLKILNENNITSRKYYHPLDDSIISNDFFSRIVCVPCNIDLDTNDIELIFNTIFNFIVGNK